MKTDRLLGILTVLLRQDKTTARELAQKFEVSKRTIVRDVQALCLGGMFFKKSEYKDEEDNLLK